ncbi:FtsB family cell division protein [Effusibacillus consociatus]|uniref:Septum formation initiator family protein n=1 Tax=Effusibacillus consociatus TaxID=1117041 RepID=A0ABV9Q5J6_9BACL
MKKSRSSTEKNSNVIYVVPGQTKPVPQPGDQKRAKRKPKLRALFLVVFVLWALYTYFFVLTPNKARLEKEQQELQQNLTGLRQQEQELKTELNNLQDESYIARLARKYYNMIKEGEIIYKPGE